MRSIRREKRGRTPYTTFRAPLAQALHAPRIQTLFKWLKRCSKIKGSEYLKIAYSQRGTPEENTKKLKELIVEGNEWGRGRTRESAEMLGHLFSCFLLIEHKLSLLLVGFCPDIESRMFGQKIQVFKDFIKEVEKRAHMSSTLSITEI